jgi:hypothetical protein
MTRYNVNHGNKWACFSSIVDGVVTKFMDKSDYEAWRQRQCGDHTVSSRNIMTMKEAVSSIRIYNNHDESIKELLSIGLSQEEAEKLIFDIETEYYCPILKENGFRFVKLSDYPIITYP